MLFMVKALLVIAGLILLLNRFALKMLFKVNLSEKKGLSIASYALMVFGVASLAFVPGIYHIKEKHSGHITTTTGKPLESNRLIAFTSEGQRGLQSELLKPGWGHNFKYPFTMDIDQVPDFVVPAGKFAVITARDGAMNPNIIAKDWDTIPGVDNEQMILDVEYFIKSGGERGIQQYLLTTGVYRLNQFQWHKIELHDLTEVKANEVLVIESKFGKAPAFKETSDDEILSVPLVADDSFRGIIDNAYPSGFYAIHPRKQEAHRVSIVLQTFIYGGGYTSKTLDLRIDPENDKLITDEGTVNPPEQKDGAAFSAKTKDNHTVYFDVRVLGQIEPIQGPRFIGTIRDPKSLDDRVIEPFTRNILSNLTLEYTALELKNAKKELGERVSEILRERTIKTGFRTKTVEITNIDIPAIVLIPGKIASASDALKDALIQKEQSVEQAIKVRNMQEQANSQEELARATVANKAADQNSEAIGKLAEANRIKAEKEADAARYAIEQETIAMNDRITQQAAAYKELADIIGKEAVAALVLQESINGSADKFQSPEVLVVGAGQEEVTSIVSAHMISKGIRDGANQAANGAASQN